MTRCPSLDALGNSHDVYLSAFYVDRSPVSVRRYQACVDAGGCTPLEPWTVGLTEVTDADPADWPLAGVWGATHQQAVRFCEWDGAALITGAQWEKAATGVLDSVVMPWDPSNLLYCSIVGITPECQAGVAFPPRWPNPLPVTGLNNTASSVGVLQLYGGFFEWTSDSLAPYPTDGVVRRDPVIPGGPPYEQRGATGQIHRRELRGNVSARSEPADDYKDDYRTDGSSFRCARPAMGER